MKTHFNDGTAADSALPPKVESSARSLLDSYRHFDSAVSALEAHAQVITEQVRTLKQERRAAERRLLTIMGEYEIKAFEHELLTTEIAFEPQEVYTSLPTRREYLTDIVEEVTDEIKPYLKEKTFYVLDKAKIKRELKTKKLSFAWVNTGHILETR